MSLRSSHFSFATAIIALAFTSTHVLAQASNPAVKPIDVDAVGASLKRGMFQSKSSIAGADGKAKNATESMCMNDFAAGMFPFAVIAGAADCEPVRSEETKTSIFVAAICRKPGEFDGIKYGPSFFEGAMNWGANGGKTITMDLKRTALAGDKPSNITLLTIKQELTLQSETCK